jgi:hypothetical protein
MLEHSKSAVTEVVTEEPALNVSYHPTTVLLAAGVMRQGRRFPRARPLGSRETAAAQFCLCGRWMQSLLRVSAHKDEGM